MDIRTEGLTKEFLRKSKTANRFTAVAPLDLELHAGEHTVLMGRSGSGKSTLLNMLAGLMQPAAGKVYLGETDLYSLDDRARSAFRQAHIGVIPQGQTAIYSLNVLENVLLPVTLTGRAGEQEIARAREILDRLGIGMLAEVSPGELSGGELRRVAIARAFLRDPEILLADEPTADLDEENTCIVLTALRDAAKAGAAVFTVTHETGAEGFADRVLEMRNGSLIRNS